MNIEENNKTVANSNSGSLVPPNSLSPEHLMQIMLEKLKLRAPVHQSPFTYSYQVPPAQSDEPSVSDPYKYINPAAFRERHGQLPPSLSGIIPPNPTREDQFKTVMCKVWLADGLCHYGPNCRYAHGEHELRPMLFNVQPRNSRKFKTKLCELYTKEGICPYGERCHYIHPNPNDPNNQEFFKVNRMFQDMQRQVIVNSLGQQMSDRHRFSASLPIGTNFFSGPSCMLQNGLSNLNAISDASTSLMPYPPPSLSSIHEDDPTSPSLKPTSSNNSDSAHSPQLKQQRLKDLWKKKDFEFIPAEAQTPKSDYGPFDYEFNTREFASSFAGTKS